MWFLQHVGLPNVCACQRAQNIADTLVRGSAKLVSGVSSCPTCSTPLWPLRLAPSRVVQAPNHAAVYHSRPGVPAFEIDHSSGLCLLSLRRLSVTIVTRLVMTCTHTQSWSSCWLPTGDSMSCSHSLEAAASKQNATKSNKPTVHGDWV